MSLKQRSSGRRAFAGRGLVLLLAACQPAARPPDLAAQAAIRRVFAGWQRQQLLTGAYWPADSCRPTTAARYADKPGGPPMGLPADSADYQFSFADLNQDGRLDGVGMFAPVQCDGGNGVEGVQTEVVVLSSPRGYQASDSLRLDRFAGTDFDDEGFYNVDSLGPNRIYATYLERHFGNGPDVARPVVFDFARHRLVR